VKSVLGEFSFGVSVGPNKGPQSGLGLLFTRFPPVGGTGNLPPALYYDKEHLPFSETGLK